MSRRNPEPPPRRPTRITVPEQAGPHVKLIFAEMGRQRVTYDQLAERSGVLRVTVKAWRNKNSPSLANIEAVLSVLGFDFVAIPRAEVMPKDLVAALRPISDSFNMTMPKTIQALVAVVTASHDRAMNPGTEPPRPRNRRRHHVAPDATRLAA